MKCPRCGAENADHARFCAQCGQALVAEAAMLPTTTPSMMSTPKAGVSPLTNGAVDPNLAFLLELILGLFGLMGIGWLYAGQVAVGIALLIGWFVVIGLGVFGSIATSCLGLCLWIPAHIVGPIVSAIVLRNQLQQNSFDSIR